MGSFRRRRSILFNDPAIAALSRESREVFSGARHAARLAVGGESGGLTHLESVRRPGSRMGSEAGSGSSRGGTSVLRQGALLAKHASEHGRFGSQGDDNFSGELQGGGLQRQGSVRGSADTHLFTGIDDEGSVSGRSVSSKGTGSVRSNGYSSSRRIRSH